MLCLIETRNIGGGGKRNPLFGEKAAYLVKKNCVTFETACTRDW